jgi:AcrR family transcriptional regulator
MTPKPITRAGQKARVREAITQAALTLFEAKGFEGATVDEIAAKANVSTRTFFRYFPTKDHVAFPSHNEYVAHFHRLLREHRDAGAPIDVAREALRSISKLYMDARDDHRRWQRVISASPALIARSVAFDAEWESALADVFGGNGRGSRERKYRARLNAGAVMGVVNAVMAHWYAGDCREDLTALGADAIQMLEKGLRF